jgi:hypothetical protein
MRRTPPLAILIQPHPAVQATVAGLVALAATGLAVWALGHWPGAWPALLLVPAVAAWAWRQARAEPRRLRWDGEAWWLAEPGRQDENPVRIAVLIDLDTWLLLHASPGRAWLAVARRQQAPYWGALRATLFAAPGGAVQR